MKVLKEIVLDHWLVLLFCTVLFCSIGFEVIYLTKVAPVANLQVVPDPLRMPAPAPKHPIQKCKVIDSAADYDIEQWQFWSIYNATMNPSGSFMGSSM